MKLSDALTLALIQLEVKHVFGVSGANIEHLHDAIHRLGNSKLVSVLAKMENGAAFMADGYARVHRKLGVCCATSGGGMVNLLTGIAESYADCVPVLAIVGQAPQNLEGNGAFQDSSGLHHSIDGQNLWRAVAKYSTKINKGEEFWPALQEAVISALSTPWGPSVLLIPRNLWDAEVKEISPNWGQQTLALILKKTPQTQDLEVLKKALSESIAPVLILGSRALGTNKKELQQFAKKYGVMVATSMSATQSYYHEDEHYLGIVGAAGHPSAHQYVNEQADLIIAAGTTLRVMTRSPIEASLKHKRLIFISDDTDSISDSLSACEVIIADTGELIASLNKETGIIAKKNVIKYEKSYVVPALSKSFAEVSALEKTSETLGQSAAILELNAHILPNSHIFYDAGNCAAAALHLLNLPPQATANVALGMGGMGYSIGASIGASLGSAAKNHSVVIVGDGAFLMCGLEVHTAVELNLPILFVIFNNAMHGMCVTREQLFFDGRVECATFSRVDFAKIAQGLAKPDAIWTAKASTIDELKQALADYFANPHRTGVLDLIIEHEEIPPFAPFLAKDAETASLNELKKRKPS